MCVTLKDISKIDKYIYYTALLLEQPFTTAELLEAVHVDHAGWKIEMIKTRCKKYRKQKMLRKIGHLRNIKYECLLSIEDLKNATYIYSKPIDRLPSLVCGM